MKATIKTISTRIEELKNIMAEEVNNNFANGELWNNCHDAICNLESFGQENTPEELKDNDGLILGYKLENGTEVYFEGMTFENSY